MMLREHLDYYANVIEEFDDFNACKMEDDGEIGEQLCSRCGLDAILH